MAYEGESLTNLQRQSIAIDIPNEALRVIDSSMSGIKPSAYTINDWKETGSVTYTLNMNSSGKWLFIKYDESAKSARYANESNNPTMTTYALASADYLTLNYDLLEVLN